MNTTLIDEKHSSSTGNVISIMPHMVTVKALAKATGISEYSIRALIQQDKIVYIKAGKKYLINFDKFIGYLNGEC